MAFYDFNGDPCSAYTYAGVLISGNDDNPVVDYTEYSNDYQKSILDARDEWAEEYRADSSILPIVLSTDQHYNIANTDFTQLASAVNWGECGAFINLGDTCSGRYSANDLRYWKQKTANIPKTKRIEIMGNHDVWVLNDAGNGYDMADADEIEEMRSLFFNNSSWESYQMAGQLVETFVDTSHNIRYVTIGAWDDSYGNYAKYHNSATNIDAFIQYLSENDSNDIVVLSHVQPLSGAFTKIKPAVDGGSGRTSTTNSIKDVAMDIGLNQLIIARKEKTSGTFTDADGVDHAYDFSECTSDILCILCGHEHTDWYVHCGGVPVVVFDALGYDKYPFFMVNIDRNQERINIWKVGTDSNTYNYQIPFSASE